MQLYILTCGIGCLPKCQRLGNEPVHHEGEIISITDFKASATLLQFLCLLEFLVIRTEDDRYVPHCCLGQVVDAYAKATTHLGHVTILIYRGEQAKAVDDEDISLLEQLCLTLAYLTIAQHPLARQQFYYLLYVTVVYDMRGYHHLPVALDTEVSNENLFVGLP